MAFKASKLLEITKGVVDTGRKDVQAPCLLKLEGEAQEEPDKREWPGQTSSVKAQATVHSVQCSVLSCVCCCCFPKLYIPWRNNVSA